jgi:hypothetical protein
MKTSAIVLITLIVLLSSFIMWAAIKGAKRKRSASPAPGPTSPSTPNPVKEWFKERGKDILNLLFWPIKHPMSLAAIFFIFLPIGSCLMVHVEGAKMSMEAGQNHDPNKRLRSERLDLVKDQWSVPVMINDPTNPIKVGTVWWAEKSTPGLNLVVEVTTNRSTNGDPLATEVKEILWGPNATEGHYGNHVVSIRYKWVDPPFEVQRGLAYIVVHVKR